MLSCELFSRKRDERRVCGKALKLATVAVAGRLRETDDGHTGPRVRVTQGWGEVEFQCLPKSKPRPLVTHGILWDLQIFQFSSEKIYENLCRVPFLLKNINFCNDKPKRGLFLRKIDNKKAEGRRQGGRA